MMFGYPGGTRTRACLQARVVGHEHELVYMASQTNRDVTGCFGLLI